MKDINTKGANLITGDGCKPNTISIEIGWIDPEKTRPQYLQEILFESAVGIYIGKYYSFKNGYVKVGVDKIEWEDVYQWIPKPKDFKP